MKIQLSAEIWLKHVEGLTQVNMQKIDQEYKIYRYYMWVLLKPYIG